MLTKNAAIVREIEAQIMTVDTDLKNEENGSVSVYVDLLMKKRQLVELLYQEQIKKDYTDELQT